MALKTSLMRTLRIGRPSISSMYSFVPSCSPSFRYSGSSRLFSTRTGTDSGMKETGVLGRRRLIGSKLLRTYKQPIIPKVMVDDRNEESNNEEDHKEEEDNEDEQDYETEDEDEEDYTDDEVQNDIEGEGDLEQLIDRSSQYIVPDVDEATNEFSRLGLLTDIVKGLASQGFTTPTPVQVCYSYFPVKLLSNNTLTSCYVD